MRQIPEALTQHLASGATTLCWCWRLVRRDGIVLGFTDHDRPISFDGTVFEASAGFTASEVRDSIGLAVDNLEVEGAVTSERLSEADLAAGLYDDAAVDVFRVNWQDPEQRVLVKRGSAGEVRRSGESFVAEIRGLAHVLNQPGGRLYQYTCDAELGDSRCGVDLEQPDLKASASVSASLSPAILEVTGLEGFATGWFDRGRMVFLDGPQSGQIYQVKAHEALTDRARLTLWQPPVETVTAGQTVELRAGCDKTIATCRDKFLNVANFRGFPHMPGTGFVTKIHGGA